MKDDLEKWREYKRTGDTRLRNELIAPHLDLADSVSAKYYNNRDDARQDAFLGLLVAAETFDPERRYSFRSWARHKMRYEVINQFRKFDSRSRYKFRVYSENEIHVSHYDEEDKTGEFNLESVADRNRGPEEEALRGEVVAMCHDAVSRLPRHQRRAIESVFFDGVSQQETARIFNVSRHNIYSSIGQSYHKLRYILRGISDAI